ncbi:MAG: PAS domain S-box protein, partial [Pseudomonas sp.]
MTDPARQLQDLERLAFQVSPAPQVITGNRRMLDLNEAFQTLFGYERDELLGELILKLYPSQADFNIIGERSLS